MRSILEAGLKKLAPNEPTFAPGNRDATVIAVAAQKGGVGKTTTAVGLGSALALVHNQRVLIIDIDGQGHVGASLGVGAITAGDTLSSILLASAGQDLLHAVVETPVTNLHITAPDTGLSEAEAVLSSRMGREFILGESLGMARTHYDTILIDCPPNLGNLTLNALMAADQILVPCDMSTLALDGVRSLLEAVATIQSRLHHDLGVLGVLRTRVDRRNTLLNQAVDEALMETYPHLLLNAVIPINNALAKAQAVGQSIHVYATRSTGAQAYQELAEEVLDRLEVRAQALARL